MGRSPTTSAAPRRSREDWKANPRRLAREVMASIRSGTWCSFSRPVAPAAGVSPWYRGSAAWARASSWADPTTCTSRRVGVPCRLNVTAPMIRSRRRICRACGAPLRGDVRWCLRCLRAGARAHASGSRLEPGTFVDAPTCRGASVAHSSRWEKSVTTFGPVGRIGWTCVVALFVLSSATGSPLLLLFELPIAVVFSKGSGPRAGSFRRSHGVVGAAMRFPMCIRRAGSRTSPTSSKRSG